ncbi:MAG: hypothetical protein ACJA0T_000125 [Colwellia sp.]|jgi:hypothetical protein
MEIQSAFASGVQGFQKAQGDATQASADIAANLAVRPEDFGIGQENNTDNANTTEKKASSAETPDLNKATVDLKVAEFQSKASANVIQTADETLGTLLDVRV